MNFFYTMTPVSVKTIYKSWYLIMQLFKTGIIFTFVRNCEKHPESQINRSVTVSQSSRHVVFVWLILCKCVDPSGWCWVFHCINMTIFMTEASVILLRKHVKKHELNIVVRFLITWIEYFLPWQKNIFGFTENIPGGLMIIFHRVIRCHHNELSPDVSSGFRSTDGVVGTFDK